MKKLLFFLVVIGLASTTVRAQKIEKPMVPGKIRPTKTSPPSPVVTKGSETPNTPDASNASIYTLTSVRVSIKTGSDNKEFPSKVDFLLFNKGKGYIFYQAGENMRNEMKVNSTTEFGLEKHTAVVPDDLTLKSLQVNGVGLRIFYNPNLLTDAWKIEGVTLTLEFKDQNGALHPTLGNKTIVFNNASGFLDAFNHVLMCTTDGQLQPITSSIQK
jgi:hypothetical protein